MRLERSTYPLLSKIVIKAFKVSASISKFWPPSNFAYFRIILCRIIHMCSRLSSLKLFSNKVVHKSVSSTIEASSLQVNLLFKGVTVTPIIHMMVARFIFPLTEDFFWLLADNCLFFAFLLLSFSPSSLIILPDGVIIRKTEKHNSCLPFQMLASQIGSVLAL